MLRRKAFVSVDISRALAHLSDRNIVPEFSWQSFDKLPVLVLTPGVRNPRQPPSLTRTARAQVGTRHCMWPCPCYSDRSD
eukprot:scaffold188770_cov42-Prasinocladus_malaysianus.AAC.1